ncbi:transcription factor [Saxophila tyrrhenica]|uniref:Transcription factor n=1 Tax=Saxophila tyrrhenica TaxID=1690608 RepID=A0AAV9P0A2_9PEZI|nr:transcription factor [Saxophila tyrrhenica]
MAHNSTDSLVIPSFRVKRSHKKSRTGCLVCRRRRVKCDETRPGCTICKRRGLECTYDEGSKHAPTRTCSSSEGVVSRKADSTPSSASPVSPATSPSTLGVLETDLVQHYLSHTRGMFELYGGSSQAVWDTVIPALAYSSSTVRLGMLTFAALCLHHDTKQTPDESLKYLQTAEYYGEQFVDESSKQLREMSPGDADPNLACARLLTVLSLGFFRVYQQRDGWSITELGSWTWLHMIRGIIPVFHHYKDSSGPMNEMVARDLGPDGNYAKPSNGNWYNVSSHFEAHPQFNFIRTTTCQRFQALDNAVAAKWSTFNDQQVEDVLAAISHLREVTETTCYREVHSLMRALQTWPVNISKGFVDMLVSGDLLALAVYAHWLMLVVLAEDIWWMDDMGRHGLKEIIELCDAEPTAHIERSLLEWPRRMLCEVGGQE